MAEQPDADPDATGDLEQDPSEQDAAADRTDLFRYLIAENAPQYRALMTLFAGPLLADLSAAEAASQLTGIAAAMTAEDVAAACKQLESWGNLVRGVRDARVATVRDYLRSRTRYQASKLGGRVHREAEAVLAAGDGARDVARELLGTIVELLERITSRLVRVNPDSPLDVTALAADVTTVFNNQTVFNESVRDFYAYLNAVLTRYDLAGTEYQQFKGMLLDYVDLITADVVRHAPAVVDRFDKLFPYLDELLDALFEMPSLQLPDGTTVERLPGRTREEWEQLRGWYTGRDGRSGPDTLRNAAELALGQLITNAKRMLAPVGTGTSRRTDLLKLAGWFDRSSTDQAHRLYAAAFATYPSRHLLIGPDELNPRDGATTSWWDASAVDVPISLRDRGDRAARGRSASVPDPGLDQAALLAQAEQESEARQAAAAELIAAGVLHQAHISPASRDLLLDRLGDLLAIHQELNAAVSSTESDLNLLITAVPTPGEHTVLCSPDGNTTIHDLRITAHSSTAAAARTAARTIARQQMSGA